MLINIYIYIYSYFHKHTYMFEWTIYCSWVFEYVGDSYFFLWDSSADETGNPGETLTRFFFDERKRRACRLGPKEQREVYDGLKDLWYHPENCRSRNSSP